MGARARGPASVVYAHAGGRKAGRCVKWPDETCVCLASGFGQVGHAVVGHAVDARPPRAAHAANVGRGGEGRGRGAGEEVADGRDGRGRVEFAQSASIDAGRAGACDPVLCIGLERGGGARVVVARQHCAMFAYERVCAVQGYHAGLSVGRQQRLAKHAGVFGRKGRRERDRWFKDRWDKDAFCCLVAACICGSGRGSGRGNGRGSGRGSGASWWLGVQEGFEFAEFGKKGAPLVRWQRRARCRRAIARLSYPLLFTLALILSFALLLSIALALALLLSFSRALPFSLAV